MKVKYYYSNQIIEGKLIYIKYDNSFNYLPKKYGDISFLIHYLQITVNAIDNKFISIRGLHPYRVWKKSFLKVPVFKKGVVECIGDYDSGIAWRLEEYNHWLTYYDESNGWLCVGDKDILQEAIMFAENIGVVIVNNELVSLWLKPKIIIEEGV